MRLASLALAALALAPAALAQTVLTPGHPDLTAAAPQSYRHDVRFAGNTPRVIGSRERSETLAGDRLTMVTVRTTPSRGQQSTDTTVVAWPGLAPLAQSMSEGEETVRIAFADGRVTGRSVLGNLDEALDAPLPAGAFGPGVEERIVRSVPLRTGYTATFRVADKRGETTVDSVRVVGPDTIALPDGSTRAAWLVRLAAPGGAAAVYAIDAETREVLRWQSNPRPDMTIEISPPPPPPAAGVMRPGDPALDTSWLTGDVAAYTLYLVEPMQMEVGTSTVTRTVEGGVVTSTQTISVPQQGMNMTQTSRAAVGTLAPLSNAMTGQGEVALAFTPSAVTGTKDGAPVSAAFDAPVFDASWSGEIAQSLPFAEGYATAIAAYDAMNGLSTMTFTVKGQQTVGGVLAWEVEVVSPSGPVAYFIDPATRAMVGMRLYPQPGVVVEMRRTE